MSPFQGLGEEGNAEHPGRSAYATAITRLQSHPQAMFSARQTSRIFSAFRLPT